jgi:hypothetical protein
MVYPFDYYLLAPIQLHFVESMTHEFNKQVIPWNKWGG